MACHDRRMHMELVVIFRDWLFLCLLFVLIVGAWRCGSRTSSGSLQRTGFHFKSLLAYSFRQARQRTVILGIEIRSYAKVQSRWKSGSYDLMLECSPIGELWSYRVVWKAPSIVLIFTCPMRKCLLKRFETLEETSTETCVLLGSYLQV